MRSFSGSISAAVNPAAAVLEHHPLERLDVLGEIVVGGVHACVGCRVVVLSS